MPGKSDLLSLKVPAALPEFAVTPTHGQLFMFSAVTWNRHHIHYNKEAAVAEGHADVVVHRALLGNFFARQLSNWLGENGAIRELSWKVVRSALPGRLLLCRGEAKTRGERDGKMFMQCELQMVDAEGHVVATGQAELELYGEDRKKA